MRKKGHVDSTKDTTKSVTFVLPNPKWNLSSVISRLPKQGIRKQSELNIWIFHATKRVLKCFGYQVMNFIWYAWCFSLTQNLLPISVICRLRLNVQSNDAKRQPLTAMLNVNFVIVYGNECLLGWTDELPCNLKFCEKRGHVFSRHDHKCGTNC